MLSCHDVQDWLSARLDGELTGQRATRVEAHLAGCAVCRAQAEELSRVDRFLLSEPPLPSDPRLRSRLRAALAHEPRAAPPPPSRPPSLPGGAPRELMRGAGPAAMAFAVVALLMMLREEPVAPPAPIASVRTVEVARVIQPRAKTAGRPGNRPAIAANRSGASPAATRSASAERVAASLSAELARLGQELDELSGALGTYKVATASEAKEQHQRTVARSFESWK